VGKLKAVKKGVDALSDKVAELVRLGYPESTAQKIASGELPMDHASRMARAKEQGFDVENVAYHGSGSQPDAFEVGLPSKRYTTFSERDIQSQGVFFADNAEDARQYGDDVGPYFLRSEQSLTPPSDISVSSRGNDEGLKKVQRLYDDVEYSIAPAIDETGYIDVDGGMAAVPADDDGRYLDSVMTSDGMDWYHMDNPEVVARLKERGYDSVVVHEPDGVHANRSTMMLDPSNIRSTNAAFDPDQKDSANLLAGGAAAAVGLGAATQSDESEAGVITKGGKKIIEAFHGSPHKFDKFSMDNIGTGEGAQAYGHGLYFADSEDVARGYKESLTARIPVKRGYAVDGNKYYQGSSYNEWLAADIANNASFVRFASEAEFEDWLERELSARYMTARQDFDPENIAQKVRDFRVNGVEGFAERPDGSLYRAHLDVDPDTLLDWDAADWQQPAAVKEFAKQLDLPPEYGGNDLMQAARKKFGAEGAAAAMREAGIPGIRYLDGDSRSAGEGSYNYVMFDDKPISIQERGFATPEALAATATAGAAATFAQMRQEKQGRWAQMREDLVNTMANVAAFTFDTIDLPWQGLLGASRVAGGLASGESFNQAMNAGANQVRQPIEQTADDLGGAMVDATGSPALGTAVNVGVNLGGPI